MTGPLDRLEAITRDGESQIVERAARAAGLVGDYASHSLRAGFVTDALDAGVTREQVQRHGRWINIGSIDPYFRKTLVWGPSTPSDADLPSQPCRPRAPERQGTGGQRLPASSLSITQPR